MLQTLLPAACASAGLQPDLCADLAQAGPEQVLAAAHAMLQQMGQSVLWVQERQREQGQVLMLARQQLSPETGLADLHPVLARCALRHHHPQALEMRMMGVLQCCQMLARLLPVVVQALLVLAQGSMLQELASSTQGSMLQVRLQTLEHPKGVLSLVLQDQSNLRLRVLQVVLQE